MKTINIYFSIILLALLSSCNDFLDINPEGDMANQDVDYTKRENMFLSVSNAYASMRSGLAHGLPYFGMLEITSDDADKGSEANDGPDMKAMDNFTYNPGTEAVNNYWVGQYNVASAANNAIFTLPNFIPILNTETDQKDYNCMMGESRFIRAYAYFNLVRAYGGVPIIDTLMTSEQLAQQPRKTVDQVYSFIHEDLNYAVGNIYESYNKKDWAGRITKYSAMALKAKVLMYQSQWDSVAYYTDQIIESRKFGLLPTLYEVFRPDGENSRESLFEIQASLIGKTDGTPGTAAPTIEEYGYYQGPRGNEPSNMQGWGFKVPSNALINFLNQRGDNERYKATVMVRGTKTIEGDSIKTKCTNPYYNMKTYTPSSYNKWSFNGYSFDYNIRVIRYAEVLLMNAEAKIHTGGDAATPLNEVRDRAKLTAIDAPTLQDVYDERRAELALEENRFYDLVRTGQAPVVLGPLGFITGKHELFPIPQRQRDLNPSLTQNNY